MISKMHSILAAIPGDGLILQVEICDRLGEAEGIGAMEKRGLIEAMQDNTTPWRKAWRKSKETT